MSADRQTATLVGIFSFASFAGGTSKYVIGPLIPDITVSFDVTTATVGLALSGMWFAFALVQFLGGILADTVGERSVLLLSISLVFLGSAVLFLTPVFSLFLLGLVFLGAGTGLFLVASTTYISRVFETIGGKLGVVIMGSSISGLLAPVIAITVSSHFDWQSVLIIGALLTVPLFVAVYMAVKPLPRTASSDRTQDLSSSLTLLLNRRVLLMVLFGASVYFVFQAIVSFFPTMVRETATVSTQTAGLSLSVFFLLSAIGNPAFGRLSERVGRRWVLAFCIWLSLVGFVVLLVATGRFVFVGITLIGIGFGWGSTFTATVVELFFDPQQGTGYGLTNTIANLLGSSGSAVTGIVAVRYGWHSAIGLLACILVCSLLILIVDAVSQ